MTHVIRATWTATWTAKPGEETAVVDILDRVRQASLSEPGCPRFWLHRSLEDPSVLFLYEQYASEADFEAQAASNQARRLVLENAVHRLASRRRERFGMLGEAAEQSWPTRWQRAQWRQPQC